MFFSNTAVPFPLPPIVQLRVHGFCTVPVWRVFLGGTVVDTREPSSGLAARELQLHLLEDKPPGCRSLRHHCPLILRAIFPYVTGLYDSSQVGPRYPYRAGPPYNKHSEILTLVLLISHLLPAPLGFGFLFILSALKSQSLTLST